MDKFLLKVCNKDTKKIIKTFSIFIVNLEQVSVQQTNDGSYITPFVNRVSILESSCLLRDGFDLAMKNTSKFLCVLLEQQVKYSTKRSLHHY